MKSHGKLYTRAYTRKFFFKKKKKSSVKNKNLASSMGKVIWFFFKQHFHTRTAAGLFRVCKKVNENSNATIDLFKS